MLGTVLDWIQARLGRDFVGGTWWACVLGILQPLRCVTRNAPVYILHDVAHECFCGPTKSAVVGWVQGLLSLRVQGQLLSQLWLCRVR